MVVVVVVVVRGEWGTHGMVHKVPGDPVGVWWGRRGVSMHGVPPVLRGNWVVVVWVVVGRERREGGWEVGRGEVTRKEAVTELGEWMAMRVIL